MKLKHLNLIKEQFDCEVRKGFIVVRISTKTEKVRNEIKAFAFLMGLTPDDEKHYSTMSDDHNYHIYFVLSNPHEF